MDVPDSSRQRRHLGAHIAAARELRDRYLEHFNSGLALPNAKYEVARMIEAGPMAMLTAA